MSECVLSGRTIDTSHQNALTDSFANDCISDWGAFGSLVLICLFVLPLFTKTLKHASQRTRARPSHFMLNVGPGNHGNVGKDQRNVLSVLIATGKGM